MIKRRGTVLIVLSLVLGTFAAMGANNWLNNRLDSGEPDDTSVAVVVAALPIPYGTKVSTRHVKIQSMPPELAPENTFRELAEVEEWVANTSIETGEILLRSKFVQHELGSTLAALVNSNMRAVTVRVNDVIGVAGFLLPGNRVDVIAVRGGRNTKASTDTVLHNIRVLAVDQTTATEENMPIIVRAVTLELAPDEALVLVKAKAEGEIQLTLRNPLDEQVAEIEKPKPAPAPKRVVRATQAPSSTTIQIIRGTQVNKQKTRI